MVLAEAGEAEIVYCTECQYAANVEKAEAKPVDSVPGGQDRVFQGPAAEEISTPGVRTIAELEEFLGVPATRMIKTLIYRCR